MIRPPRQQRGRQSRRHGGRHRGSQILARDRKAFRRPAQQNRQGIARFQFLLLQRRQGGLLRRQRGALLNKSALAKRLSCHPPLYHVQYPAPT
jgi:hypothetical protein